MLDVKNMKQYGNIQVLRERLSHHPSPPHLTSKHIDHSVFPSWPWSPHHLYSFLCISPMHFIPFFSLHKWDYPLWRCCLFIFHRQSLLNVFYASEIQESHAHAQLLRSVRLFVTLWAVCGPLDSSVHGIFQTRILEWVAISYSRESSWSRGWTQVSHICGIGRYVLYHWASRGFI